MGKVRVRFLVNKGKASYWQPTKKMRAAGFMPVRLYGTPAQIIQGAEAETAKWDRFRGIGPMAPLPGTVAQLREAYSGRVKDGVEIYPASFEFKNLRPRTKKDYRTWLDEIENEFGEFQVTAFSPRSIKAYYHRIVDTRGLYAGYHMMIVFRAFLSWCVSEDKLDSNPALKVVVRVPEARKVKWKPEETRAMIDMARKEGRSSIALACLLADWLAQRPFDVRDLKWSNYDGRRIVGIKQGKTETELPPIELTDEIIAVLDALKAGTVTSLTGHIILSEGRGQPYSETNFQHLFAAIRRKAKLPDELKFADFRRTGATELAESDAGDDQLRSITGHKDRDVVKRYALPSAKTAKLATDKRMRHREAIAKEAEDA